MKYARYGDTELHFSLACPVFCQQYRTFCSGTKRSYGDIAIIAALSGLYPSAVINFLVDTELTILL